MGCGYSYGNVRGSIYYRWELAGYTLYNGHQIHDYIVTLQCTAIALILGTFSLIMQTDAHSNEPPKEPTKEPIQWRYVELVAWKKVIAVLLLFGSGLAVCCAQVSLWWLIGGWSVLIAMHIYFIHNATKRRLIRDEA
jgi:hypothetical protein